MTKDYEILDIMRNEDHVVVAELMDDDMKRDVLAYEMKRLDEVVPFLNKGLQEALDKQEAIVIIKEFDYEPGDQLTGESSALTLRTESGKIIGEMVYDEDEIEYLKGDPTAYFISDNFVTYSDPTAVGEKQFFVFEGEDSSFITDKDLESTVESLIVGVPSTETDHYIRDRFNLSSERKLGTLIIGFTPN
ncbi:MAG: hypothetical protein SOZ23_01225 [Methanosphaera sp.]|uniref:hypothetical protein n=1 Tax=Methanosphaera sp. TaxID=2666342 RepID=UPI0025EF6F5E|nr:hypothetical protein [Methanosphaera sp.]MCI5866494.1 hypothetical protein [Methanosphaera sp.]MDD6534939.1 hypothetical protein [Methanosphaera sp.]MDY3955398.1 hypothetical protein [Methanosphaera sp.]